MPVDRARRDAAALTLAAFLRGEIDYTTLVGHYHHLATVPADSNVHDRFLEGILQKGVLPHRKDGTDPIPYIPKSLWTPLLRTLAFLKSDLSNEGEKEPNFDALDRHQQILHARWHIIVLLPFLLPAYLIAWWIIVAAWIGSFILYQIAMKRREKVFRIANRIDERTDYAPFKTAKEFKDHESMLEQFHLPTYENSRHVPVQASGFRNIIHSLANGLTLGAIYLVFGYMAAFPILAWPIWLVATAFSSRNASQSKI